MNIFYLSIFLNFNIYYCSIDVLNVLDYITNGIDFFLFNPKHWDSDLIWTLNTIQIQTNKILDKYISSQVDFDASFVPILRRFYFQSDIFAQKIYRYLLPLEHKQYKNYIHNVYEKFKNDTKFEHMITLKELIWDQKIGKHLKASDYKFCLKYSFNGIYNCDIKLNKNKYKDCNEVMLSKFDLNNYPTSENLFFLYSQLKYILNSKRAGCQSHLYNNMLSEDDIINFQSQLCSNAKYVLKNVKVLENPKIYYDIDMMCLFLGYMDFLDPSKLEQLLIHHISRYKVVFNQIHKVAIPPEIAGCFLRGIDTNDILYKIKMHDSNSISQPFYEPFSHPLAFDFDWDENSPGYTRIGSLQNPNKPWGQDPDDSDMKYKNDLCDPEFTKIALRFLMMYTRYLLDPGPDSLSSYRLDPETYEVNNVSLEGFREENDLNPILSKSKDNPSNRDLPIMESVITDSLISVDDDKAHHQYSKESKLAAIFIMGLAICIIYKCKKYLRGAFLLSKRALFYNINLALSKLLSLCFNIICKTKGRLRNYKTLSKYDPTFVKKY